LRRIEEKYFAKRKIQKREKKERRAIAFSFPACYNKKVKIFQGEKLWKNYNT
jgi:hypothetical protein